MFSLLQIMAERKNAKALACSSLQERAHVNLDVPLQGRSAPLLLCLALSAQVTKRRVSDGSLVYLVSLRTELDSADPGRARTRDLGRGLELILCQQG